MTRVDPSTPVIVGVGQITQHPDDPADAVEAISLMERAVERAADDAGTTAILRRLDAVAVVYGAWRYRDPGRLVADRIGSTQATTILSHHGGNTPQAYVNHLATRIANGQLEAVAITGAETIWSRRRQRAAGIERSITTQGDEIEPTERFQHDLEMSTDFERARGLDAPLHFYPLFESAIRAARGETHDAHRRRLAELWARFNQVAVANPFAWVRTPMTADEIREPSPANRMVGYPYTKAMNSNWDLDQGAALLLCSAHVADGLGIDRDRWVFPVAGTEGTDTPVVGERRDLHSSPAIEEAGRQLFELAGCGPDDLAHIDLYSCFPSAVQIGAEALGIGLDRQLTVTGGLTFAGGPLNNYVTHSIATMVGRLRADPGTVGLVTANGGYVTKHALGLYSTDPPIGGFAATEVQDAIDRYPTVACEEDHVGAGTIEAYTVMHDKAGPQRLLAAVRTPSGGRTWANSEDRSLLLELMAVEGIGLRCTVADTGELHVD